MFTFSLLIYYLFLNFYFLLIYSSFLFFISSLGYRQRKNIQKLNEEMSEVNQDYSTFV